MHHTQRLGQVYSMCLIILFLNLLAASLTLKVLTVVGISLMSSVHLQFDHIQRFQCVIRCRKRNTLVVTVRQIIKVKF